MKVEQMAKHTDYGMANNRLFIFISSHFLLPLELILVFYDISIVFQYFFFYLRHIFAHFAAALYDFQYGRKLFFFLETNEN